MGHAIGHRKATLVRRNMERGAANHAGLRCREWGFSLYEGRQRC